MAFYDVLAATALRILAAKGQDLTLRTIADTTPGTAFQPTRTATDVTVKGILDSVLMSEVDSNMGDVIGKSTRRYVIAASGLAADPAIGDQIVENSVVHEIVNVAPVSPAGTPVIHVILCN